MSCCATSIPALSDIVLAEAADGKHIPQVQTSRTLLASAHRHENISFSSARIYGFCEAKKGELEIPVVRSPFHRQMTVFDIISSCCRRDLKWHRWRCWYSLQSKCK